jgi:hypothetical protein
VLDNLTTAIVMVSLMKKLAASEREDRLFFAGIIVIAANAGGAWSPHWETSPPPCFGLAVKSQLLRS